MFKGSTRSHGTVVAYAALVLAMGGGSAYAAASAVMTLGGSNTEHQATTITRTTTGPALNLAVKHGSPPLGVNSSKVVGHLNADMVDGKHAASFQPRIGRLHFTTLTLSNGWQTDCFAAGTAGAALSVDGVVHLHGSLCATPAPSSPQASTLPARFRPSKSVYLTVDECNGTTGRIVIDSNGHLTVVADPADTTADQCFTSLAGVTYTLPY